MKAKILLITLFIFLIGRKAQSQQLTLQETIDYVNQSMGGSNKVSLQTDGIFEYSGIASSGKNFVYRVHISELQIPQRVEQPMMSLDGSNPWCVSLRCKGVTKIGEGMYNMVPCIQIISENSNENTATISLTTKEKDKYSSEKLLNAISYLIELAKEKGFFDRKDNDPFAPSNFNSKSVEIGGSVRNDAIQLERKNGVYHVMVSIGGIKRMFILDSGASEVLISSDYENQLIKMKIINKESYLPAALYRIADGSVVQCRRLIIPQLLIGGFIVRNVPASVGIGSVPLLLGKSVLDKFSRWTIDNSTETLNLKR